jgi:hypothetical protein
MLTVLRRYPPTVLVVDSSYPGRRWVEVDCRLILVVLKQESRNSDVGGASVAYGNSACPKAKCR